MANSITITLTAHQAELTLVALDMLSNDLCAAVDDSGDIEVITDLMEEVHEKQEEACLDSSD